MVCTKPCFPTGTSYEKKQVKHVDNQTISPSYNYNAPSTKASHYFQTEKSHSYATGMRNPTPNACHEIIPLTLKSIQNTGKDTTLRITVPLFINIIRCLTYKNCNLPQITCTLQLYIQIEKLLLNTIHKHKAPTGIHHCHKQAALNIVKTRPHQS